ncbi:hypothetical protein QM012_004770 [Aureobasidium pullulans]|uniref:Uncharacterized protein n=1 Tax=Aureobasidium pullulans TaxID=5580 RepID=A0ABR0TVQ0_AURPU
MSQPESAQRAVNITPHDGSIILRQNAYADMRPFIEKLWEDRRSMCCNIYLDQFPRGATGKGATKEEEDAFLLDYFSERDFQLQGGRFLKQVLYAIAKFNEDSALTHAEKWWREYNFCASSGMDAAQIRQVLDLHQATNFPDSFLERVVLLIGDGFRRFCGHQDQLSTNVAEPGRELVPTTAQPHYQQQPRRRAVSIHDEQVRHGSGRPRQFHKQEYRGRNRRASMSPMIAPLQHMSPSFPDFDAATSGFVDAQFYTPTGFTMQHDGPFVGYYSPPTRAPEPRMPPDFLGPVYYPNDILHRRNSSFSQRPRPRLVDPHSFARFGEERFAPQRPYASQYSQRGSGHRSSFNSTIARRSSFRSGEAWQGPTRESRPFDRRIFSDHRGYAHSERNHRVRENRSHSNLAGDHRNTSADSKVIMEPSDQIHTRSTLPSLSEASSVDKRDSSPSKQDSSPRTTEDESFQTAAETPTATPTERPSCNKAQAVPNSPSNATESDEDAPDGGSPVEDFPIRHPPIPLVPTEEGVLAQKAGSFSTSPTITMESGDAYSANQQLTAGVHISQGTALKPGPKQTESFSPFARRANTKKNSKQRLGKSKSKSKSEPIKPKQFMVDTPVDMSVKEICQESVESHEKEADVENSISASVTSSLAEISTEQGEDDHDKMYRSTFHIEEPEHAEPSGPQTQSDDPSKYQTESATPQMLSTLSSVTALLSGALSSMSSNKAKKDDDSSTVSLENDVPATAPKKKSKKTKKKKKAKTATQVPDGDSTETLANETPVGSPPSNKKHTLQENTNILDTRLSSLNIREGSIVELHENKIGYRTVFLGQDQQQENLSSKHNEVVEQSRRKIQEMQEQEKLLKQKK